MSDFNWPVSIGTEPDVTATVDEAQFGDGYGQFVARGLNSVRETWQITRKGLTQAEADAIDAFLRERKGATIFTWTPPFRATEIMVRCKQWSLPAVSTSRFDFKATFIQEFAQ